MRELYLLRHSLTEANEKKLYCGWSDVPLSESGRELAAQTRRKLAFPEFDRCFTSGLRRTDETLLLLTGRAPDAQIPELREMRFGAFELRGYPELRHDAAYLKWIDGIVRGADARCPGGESQAEFNARVLRGGEILLGHDWAAALAVVHGGVIAALMARWFPGAGMGFYDWQPGPCGGWRIRLDNCAPVCYNTLQEA